MQQEFGDTYDITIYDEESGGLADLSNFTSFTLYINSTNGTTNYLTKTVSNPSGSIVRWVIASTDLNSIAAGTYVAQISMVDGSNTIRRKTDLMSVRVTSRLS